MIDFNISSAVFDAYNQAVKDIFEKKARLIFPEKREECPNCYMNTFGTRTRSISLYKPGGPYPFTEGMPCPYCEGKGYKQLEVTETIPIRIFWEVQKFYKPLVPIDLPQGSIQTIVNIIYMTKIEMAKYLIPIDSSDNIDTKKFTRIGPCYPIGFKHNTTKYIINFWGQNDH